MAKAYWEKLQDPRWQRRRLEVLEAAGWVCENCGNDADTLHVHHGHYEAGLDPWDYADQYLHVLCDGCHQKAHDLLTAVGRVMGAMTIAELAMLSIRLAHELDHEAST